MVLNQSEIEVTKKWYAILTRSRAEKKTAERLMLMNWQTYLPMYRKYRQWCDRQKMVVVPLIPSILFVYATLKQLGKNKVIAHLAATRSFFQIEIPVNAIKRISVSV